MTLRNSTQFHGVKRVSFDDAFSEFLEKIERYGLEAELVAASINAAKTIDVANLAPHQKLAVMIECRDVLVEAEWVLEIKEKEMMSDEFHS